MRHRQGEVKNSIGNGEARGLLCTTNGHDPSGSKRGGWGGAGQRGIQEIKIWDNSNNIINKIYLKMLRTQAAGGF